LGSLPLYFLRMAGTRLLLQQVFAVQFFLLLSVSLYLGIFQNPDDFLSIILFKQGGRSPLKNLMVSSPVLKEEVAPELPGLALPTVRLMCQQSQVIFWKDILEKIKLPSDKVTIEGDQGSGTVSKYCENPSLLLKDSEPLDGVDMVLCDHWIPKERPVMIAAGGSVVFYSRSIAKRLEDMSTIYPVEPAVDCSILGEGLQLVLAVDSHRPAGDWKEWMDSLQDLLPTYQSAWQTFLWSEPPVHFSVRSVDGASVSERMVDNGGHNIYRMEANASKTMFGKHSPDRLEVVLYLPVHEATFVGIQGGSMDFFASSAVEGRRMWHVLSSLTAEDMTVQRSKQAAMNDALKGVSDWLARQCLGIPMTLLPEEESLDGSLPRFYLKFWQQRNLWNLYHKTVRMARIQARIWTEGSSRTPLTTEVVQDFQDKVIHRLDEEIPALMTDQSFDQAVTAMEDMVQLLDAWQKDDLYMPPLDFPPEQYAAILAPLILPMLLPIFFGLLREYRRYREKVASKENEETKEKMN
jgi:hypothetical protein